MKSLKSAFAVSGLAMIASPAAFAAEGAVAEPWYMSTTHWAFLTLVVFLAIVWRLGAFKAIFGGLDKRAEEIQHELNQAQSMREEAATKLKEAERLQQEATDHAEAILRQAEAEKKQARNNS